MPITITRLEDIIRQREYPPSDKETIQITRELLLSRGVLELRNVQLRKARARITLAEETCQRVFRAAKKTLFHAKLVLAASVIIVGWFLFFGGEYVL